MKKTIFALVLGLVLVAVAQQPISMGPATGSFGGTLNGALNRLYWYDATASGCTPGAGGLCVGHEPRGDFYYWTAWLPNALGLPKTTGLPVVGTINDFNWNSSAPSASGNLAVQQLDTFDWATPNASHATLINAMTSYTGGENAGTLWRFLLTSGGLSTSNGGGWKNRVPFSRGGILYLPVERQIGAGTLLGGHDATIIMSPDSGAHWCNPNTWAYRSGSPGCDSSNWQADGDAPKCGSASSTSGSVCTDSTYFNATHPNMMWNGIGATGAENWDVVDFANQDGTSFPSGAGVESGCDPATYTCFMLLPTDGSIARVPNASILDITAWRYYTCPTITMTYRCNPKDSANWTATFASRTPVVKVSCPTCTSSYNTLINPYSITYMPAFKSYLMVGQPQQFAWSPTLQGPWSTFSNGNGWINGPVTFASAPALGYTAGTNTTQVTHVGSLFGDTGSGNTQGSPELIKWNFTLGKQYGGEQFQRQNTAWFGDTGGPGNYSPGAGFQLSTGHVAGSFPRRGLVWSFDFHDARPDATTWPYFVDRANYSAVITPCENTYSASMNCGTTNGTHGNSMGSHTISVGQGSSGQAHWQAAAADFLLNTSAGTPSTMQGNGTYSVVMVVKVSGTTPFSRIGGLWSAGVPSGTDNTMVMLAQKDRVLELNFGATGNPYYHYVSNFTFDTTKWYFVVTTVTATAGAPTAHVYVGGVTTAGVLTDVLAGSSFTSVSGASSQIPAVGNGPFVIGMTPANDQGQSTSSYGSLMVYSRALTLSEIGQMYKSMTTKMAVRGITLAGAVVPDLSFSATNTQLAVAYTAPSGSPCTVEGSESPTYSPLVNDVNTTLFSSSNADNRDGSVTSGTRRVFVLGQRKTATSPSDSKNYSRALQAYTTHYVRVTCGATVMTGQADTANIPLNSTYQDIPQLDRSTPGNTLMPTLPSTRGVSFIDAHSGAKILPLSIAGDRPYDSSNPATYGPFLFSSGAPRVCGASLVGPGPGYLCDFQQGDGGPNVFYYVIPSTAEVRYLGASGSVGGFNEVDGKFYSGASNNITVQSYTGTYAAGSLSFSSSTLITNLTGAINTFDSTFDPSLFTGCGFNAKGDYLHLICSRGSQDSYAWVGAVQISTASVVAAARFDDNVNCRWCVVHQIVPTGYDQPMFQIIPHSGVDGGLGQGPYRTTLTAGINSSVTTIPVAGEPACGSCGADAGVPIARVGDVFQIGSEMVKIVTKTSSTSWVVTRGVRSSTPASHSSSDNVTGACDFTQIFWKFLADPHGTDTTGTTTWIRDLVWSTLQGHDDATTGQMLSEAGDGWAIRTGSLMSQPNQPLTNNIPSQFSFAGKNANCFGNACRKHPAVGAPGSNWFGDFPVWDFVGTASGSTTLSNVTGTLYKATSNMPALSPKHYAIAAALGAEFTQPTVKAILDVSGPSVTIGGSAGDNYKMCISNATNECVSGSAKGDVYVNIPGGSITVLGTTQADETHAATAVSGLTTLTLFRITGGCSGCNTTYYWSSYTGPFPTVGMSFTVTGFATGGNNVTATVTDVHPSRCDNSSDPCIANFSRYANGAAQIGADGVSGRILASMPLRNTNDYPTFKTLADGSYMLYAVGSASLPEKWDAPSNVVMVKLPPFTAPDAVDRTTFVRAAINITTPSSLGIATATVQFGYLENGAMTDHYCTSRQEACVVVSSTVTDATPFWFETTDSASYTKASCAASCTITLPVLPSHIAYWRVAFYDGSGVFVQYGNSGVAVEGTVKQ